MWKTTGMTFVLPACACVGVTAAYAESPSGAAQSQVRSAESGNTLEEVVVSAASRINRSGFAAPTPTTVLDDNELRAKSVINIASALTSIPAFNGSNNMSTNSINSQNPGANFLNLRGLGTNRTLVLVNGRRHVPTTNTGLVDIGVVPTSLINRLEVVTGGTSAAWGSDAVAGVVNLISRTDLQGAESSVQYGISGRGDSEEFRLSLAYGMKFAGDRGGVTVAGEFSENDGVGGGQERAWARKGYFVIANPAFVPGSGEPSRLIAADGRLSNGTENGLIVSGPLRGIEFLPNSGYRQFDFGTLVGSQYSVGGDGVIPNLVTRLEVPAERTNVFLTSDYAFADSLTGFTEMSFARSHSVVPLSPAYDPGSIVIQRDNAYLPAAVGLLMDDNGVTSFQMGRWNDDSGFFIADVENETLRGLVGLRGDVGSWGWEAYYQQGKTTYDARVLDNRIRSNYIAATDAVFDSSGQVVCRSTLTNPANGCVPINLFGSGSPSAAALDYIHADQSLVTELRQHVAALSFEGEPVATWAGPVPVAFGVEYRKEEADSRVDALSAASAFSIGNPKAMRGSYDVKEAFIEAVLPLAAGQRFAKSLDLNLASRFTDYSTSGSVNTWKIAASWKPLDSMRFRATRSRDIRAPNLGELFTGALLTFPSIIDPATNQQSLVSLFIGGNPTLEPEEADGVSLGVVVEPSWLSGLRASLDFYSIEIAGAVATLGPQTIVDRCFQGTAVLCDLIERNAAGTIATIRQAPVNLNRLETSGVDLELVYRTSLPSVGGDLTLRALATYLDDLVTDDGVTRVDRAGDVGAYISSTPYWRWTASGLYQRGAASFYLEGRYVDGGAYDSTLSRDAINVYEIDSFFMLNGSVQCTLRDSDRSRVQVFGAVSNILDADPPVNPATFVTGISTNPALYDIVGRKFTIGLRVSL